MAEWTLSEKADQDLIDIYVYTYRQFGERQAEQYACAIEQMFELIAEQPDLGRIDHKIPGAYRRVTHQSHVIFYQLRESGVHIVRVLHTRMDLASHFED